MNEIKKTDTIDYNLLYRNFPAWFYHHTDDKKRFEAEEKKKPIIPAVAATYDSNESTLRNSARQYAGYGKNGMKRSSI